MLAYGLRSMPHPKALAIFAERWAPWRSVASWYMWRAVDLHREQRLPAPPNRRRASENRLPDGDEPRRQKIDSPGVFVRPLINVAHTLAARIGGGIDLAAGIVPGDHLHIAPTAAHLDDLVAARFERLT